MLERKRLRTVLAVLCAGFLLMTISTAGQPPVSFEARRDFPTNGLQTQSIVSGDFNQDGKLDLATVNTRSFSVTVQTGAGDGTFQTTGAFFTGGSINRGPVDLAAGDLNHDGKTDLAVAVLEGSVSVLIGNGNGTFQDPLILPVGFLPQSVDIGDFDADGNLDIATVNFSNVSIPDVQSLAMLKGKGDGTFEDVRRTPVGSQPFDLAIADFNSDNRPDVAVTFRGTTGSNGGISILFSNRDGTFQPAFSVPGVSSTLAIVAGDFNADGRADLAATSSGVNSGNLRVLTGNGSGGFTQTGNFPIGRFCLGLTAGDLNGDRRPDLATVSRDDQEVAVVLANSQGTGFLGPDKYVAGRDPLAVVSGDYNRDGEGDLATANSGSNSISLLLGKGGGTFTAESNFAASGRQPQFAAAADFNRDCRTDLVTANQESNNVSVLLGKNEGAFETPVNYRAGTKPFHVAVGEFNGDSNPDLAVANSGIAFSDPGSVSILIGNGNGTFQPPINVLTADAPVVVSVSDYNRDGRDDMAVVNFRSNSVSILLGQGSGNFQAAPAITFPTLSGLISSAAGDFNGDGNPDLEIVSTFQSTVFIMLGNGDGTFRRGSEIRFEIIQSIGIFAVTDLNRDAKQDLVSSNGIVLLGNGDGTFRNTPGFLTTAGEQMAVGDLNGDGVVDVVTTGGFSLRLTVHVGRGDGTFLPEIRFGAGGFPSSVLIADFTGDSKPELVTANGLDNVSLMINTKLLWKGKRTPCRP
jgi:hypothetical protein